MWMNNRVYPDQFASNIDSWHGLYCLQKKIHQENVIRTTHEIGTIWYNQPLDVASLDIYDNYNKSR